jgi:hypothetical protein
VNTFLAFNFFSIGLQLKRFKYIVVDRNVFYGQWRKEDGDGIWGSSGYRSESSVSPSDRTVTLSWDLEELSGQDFDLERPSFLQKLSEGFGWAGFRLDDEPSWGYPVHTITKLRISKKFVIRTFAKSGLYVPITLSPTLTATQRRRVKGVEIKLHSFQFTALRED